jgi:hypothetical protein
MGISRCITKLIEFPGRLKVIFSLSPKGLFGYGSGFVDMLQIHGQASISSIYRLAAKAVPH